MKAPNSRRNLDIAIQRKCGLGDEYMRARAAVAVPALPMNAPVEIEAVFEVGGDA